MFINYLLKHFSSLKRRQAFYTFCHVTVPFIFPLSLNSMWPGAKVTLSNVEDANAQTFPKQNNKYINGHRLDVATIINKP